MFLSGSALLGSGCQESPSPRKTAPTIPKELCRGGLSEDPPRSELEGGVRSFDAKEYQAAQAEFLRLAQAYPTSGSVLVWLGDAHFYDKAHSDVDGARTALPFYEKAGQLHESGCALPRRQRYYQLMGVAYAGIRLFKASPAPQSVDLERAHRALDRLRSEFPSSAEIAYTQARATCAEAEFLGPDIGGAALTSCLNYFEETLRIAEGYERPRFLRTHRSTQDWIVRSETQSEFGPLRSDARYRAVVRAAFQSALR